MFIEINKIKTESPFKDLFPLNKDIIFAIKEDIELYGYDESFPIVLWGEIVIDGHMRLEASKQADLKEVFTNNINFEDEQAALEYAVHCQRDRRNMTDADLLRCIEILDQRKDKGGNYNPQGINQYIDKDRSNIKVNIRPDNDQPTHIKTAELLDISPSKVQQARTVIDADDKIKESVLSGDKSIHKAYQDAKKEKEIKKEIVKKPTFNLTNDNIEWAKWTWNPITGCLHGCKYCYARDIANRFYPEKFKPTFRPKRLKAPYNTKNSSNEIEFKNVFVCSMADLFGNWVEQNWIDQVIDIVKDTKQWNYLFLTKNPKRLTTIDWPDNCWVGTTIDYQNRVEVAEQAFKKIKAKVKFISLEPLMEEIKFKNLNLFNWIIIGGRSQSNEMKKGQPEWEWVESLLNQAREAKVKVYFKPNLEVRPKEYPKFKKKEINYGRTRTFDSVLK